MFSVSVFRALSHGVIRFVASVRFKTIKWKHLIAGFKRIPTSHNLVSGAKTCNKTDHHTT